MLRIFQRDFPGLRVLPVLCLQLLLSISAPADPITFGMEFNFRNQSLHLAWQKRMDTIKGYKKRQTPGQEEQDAATAFSKKVQEICGSKCQVTSKKGKFGKTEYEVRFLDGWGFNISVDPKVVEIQTIPETAAQIRNRTQDYQKYVFAVAEAVGLGFDAESPDRGSGHLNIGFQSAFKDDAKAFLRFFLDYSSRPALALGIFGYDTLNAPPIGMLSWAQRRALKRIVDQVNSGAITSALEVAKLINFRVYTKSPKHATGNGTSGRHYQALGLKQMLRPEFPVIDLPFELRAIRHPKNPQEYALLAKLFELRLKYLETKKHEPLSYDPSKTISQFERTAIGKAAHFYLFINEMGRNWSQFKTLVPEYICNLLEEGFIQQALSSKIDHSSREQHYIWQNMVDPNRDSLIAKSKIICSRMMLAAEDFFSP